MAARAELYSTGQASVVTANELNSLFNMLPDATRRRSERAQSAAAGSSRKGKGHAKQVRGTVVKQDESIAKGVLEAKRKDKLEIMDRWVKEAELNAFRDKQTEKNARRKKEQRELELEWDRQADEERLIELEKRDRKERVYKEQQHAVAKEFNMQINERAVRRMQEKMALEDEGIMMKEAEDRMVEEAKRQKLLRIQEARLRNEELQRANRQASTLRQARSLAAKEEDARIMAYALDRDAKELKRAQEKERVRHEAAVLADKLRRQQERQLDRRGEEDEKRAKVHQYQVEKRARERLAREEQERAGRVSDMLRVRKWQVREKNRKLRVEKVRDAEEYEARKQEEMEMARGEEKKWLRHLEQRDSYARTLEQQMEERDKLRRLQRNDYLRARPAERSSGHEAAMADLEREKLVRVRKLKAAGVPERYYANLRAMDPTA